MTKSWGFPIFRANTVITIIMTMTIRTHICIWAMHACIHDSTHIRTSVCWHVLMSVCKCLWRRQAGRHACTHVYTCNHVLMYASVMHVFACFRVNMYVWTSCAPANSYQSSPRTSALIWMFTVRIRYTGPFVICHKKRIPSHMRTTKVQNSLRVCS